MARVDDEALAHCAGVCVRHDLSGRHIAADQVQRRADHLVTRSGNNGIHLRMHRAAEFVSFAARNAHLLTNAGADVDAVGTTSRRTVVAGGYDDVVLDDDRAKVAAQTGAGARVQPAPCRGSSLFCPDGPFLFPPSI